MSDIYKQRQYELEKELEHIEMLNNIIPKYEDYVKETNDFIDKLLDETKEINMLRNIIKEAREYIEHENFKRNVLVGVSTKKYTRDILNKLLEILDKVDKENK